MIAGRALVAGAAHGPVLALADAVSFWGGFDPGTGHIIDRSHPDCGLCLRDSVVVMPGTRGSAGTPGALAEAIRAGTAPRALVITKADINLVAGAMVAETLYGITCPVVVVAEHDHDELRRWTTLTHTADGAIRPGARPGSAVSRSRSPDSRSR